MMDPGAGSPHSFFPLTHSTQVGILPEVASLSRDDLEDLLACDDKLTEFVEGLPQVAALRNQCEQLSAQNEALAKANLERSSDYERARDATIQKVEELTSLRSSFEDMTIKQQKASEKLAPSSIQESLLIFAAQSEEDSEKIAEDFLHSHIDVDAFLDSYLEKRIETHLRKFKGERLGAQLRELHKAGF
ncbi:vacuolar protein sorting-associated protein 37A [Penaeus vannamei]|uniref:Vacuolar protein sorting-associated protein 37A n=1 Tax=Penaeus vannamei TaxID=6689 RepID=A0A423U497_PENVA|nr:vacuolar protein sorting-associated protein 37A-like [Penaeus vannamei]XP_027239101.1 vacuolar protein sorting-associated protein 37A-like [Penaeus vannamei]XP_027239102.1 vacuolar protein sorting-associated protein 37A-like [Penaeus vannamei]XP_027239103.1 vacuolar protein sorting-associated protein 37A-like [Penaeus vannamei]ROT83502.1 Vacuolar protein sorting-associated protein 37A [Penaeus vannamei]